MEIKVLVRADHCKSAMEVVTMDRLIFNLTYINSEFDEEEPCDRVKHLTRCN